MSYASGGVRSVGYVWSMCGQGTIWHLRVVSRTGASLRVMGVMGLENRFDIRGCHSTLIESLIEFCAEANESIGIIGGTLACRTGQGR